MQKTRLLFERQVEGREEEGEENEEEAESLPDSKFLASVDTHQNGRGRRIATALRRDGIRKKRGRARSVPAHDTKWQWQ